MVLITSVLLSLGSAMATVNDFADEFSASRFVLEVPDGSSIVLKGLSQFSLRDIEGRGGPGYDSITDTRTVGTRSPSVGLDVSMLAASLILRGGWQWNMQLGFSQSSAWTDAAWLEWSGGGEKIDLSFEAGHHHTVVARHEWGARRSLGSRVYWGSPEEHFVGELSTELGAVRISSAVSIAMMRPLGASTLNDGGDQAGTLAALSYDDARIFSGNTPVLGGLFMAGLGPAELTFFGFKGGLAEQGGINELFNRMANYSSLSGDTSSNNFNWWGGRFDLDGDLGQFVSEAVFSTEGLLNRRLLQGEARARIKSIERLESVEPWVRYEELTIIDGDEMVESGLPFRSVATSQAITWDWTVYTAGLSVWWSNRWVALHVEYAVILEENGAEDLSVENEPIANNEMTMQLELRF